MKYIERPRTRAKSDTLTISYLRLIITHQSWTLLEDLNCIPPAFKAL